jgi:hypothetical protein
MLSYDWRNPERVVPWKPRHRFVVTAIGMEAHERYLAAVRAAQGGPDARTQLDNAKRTWADEFKLRENDPIVLEELAGGAGSLSDMKSALEACGLHLRDARGALDRLLAAGLIESLDPHPRA